MVAVERPPTIDYGQGVGRFHLREAWDAAVVLGVTLHSDLERRIRQSG